MKLFSKALTKKMKTTSSLRWLGAFILLSGVLTPVAFGQTKGMSGTGMPGGLSGPSNSTEKPESPIADAAKAAAFRERCLLLSTKFDHKGVDFESISGIGCIISTPKGQRILAMPASMTKPLAIAQGNEKLSVPCSMLLATKLGNTPEASESMASFTERVVELSIATPQKQPPKAPMLESERRILRALDERCEVSFIAQPLSSVMKFFKDQFSVPIVIDDKAMETESISPEEPVTLELPSVTFRSALNLILKPLNQTFVIENEVLRITSYERAEKAGIDPISHWNPVGPELASERKIFQALDERGELSFNAQPLSSVMKFFKDAYNIPIVIYDRALEFENITPDEPITLELPAVSFRSALNLILEPLDLTYVIENEVLLITSKTAALAERPMPFFREKSKALIAFGGRMPAGMGGMGGGLMNSGKATLYFYFKPMQRYDSLQAAQKADSLSPATDGAIPSVDRRREYAATHGPLATSVDGKLGIAFMSLPGDFQSVPTPARVDAAGKRFVMLGQGWTEITKERDNLATVINGSPVIDQRGEPVGMFIDQKVVTLPELVQSLLTIDSKLLGYWGAESKEEVPEAIVPVVEPAAPNLDGELPALVTAEIKKQIGFMDLLSGEDREAELQLIQKEFDKRIQLRKTAVEEKLKSVQSKLERLTELSQQMNKKDLEEVSKLLRGKPARQKDQESPFDQDNVGEDPFKDPPT